MRGNSARLSWQQRASEGRSTPKICNGFFGSGIVIVWRLRARAARRTAVMSGRLEARQRTRADKVGLSGRGRAAVVRSTNLRIPSLSNMPSCQNKKSLVLTEEMWGHRLKLKLPNAAADMQPGNGRGHGRMSRTCTRDYQTTEIKIKRGGHKYLFPSNLLFRSFLPRQNS